MAASDVEKRDSGIRQTARYQSALAFLFDRIDYERVLKMPYSQRNLSLSRMRRLLELLGNPHLQVDFIHVAGTKGKGSTSAFLSAALAAAGLRCGSYTSPHLHVLEERFCINGAPCRPDELIDLIDAVQPAVLKMDEEFPGGGPTYFEITTAIACQFFLDQAVDIAILEVGLGGRLDSTNVCEPLVSVITSISFDHTKQLGNTLDKIASEKAGIIKPNVPAISGAMHVDARDAIEKIALEKRSPLLQLGIDFSHENYLSPTSEHTLGTADIHRVDRRNSVLRSINLGLLGEHQAANASVALATLDSLPPKLHPDEKAIRAGFESARCPARIEIISHAPTTIVDAAHNVASVEALVHVLQASFPNRRRRLLLGTTKGKDVVGMLRILLPAFDEVICARYENNPRGYRADQLCALAKKTSDDLGLQITDAIKYRNSPEDAWQAVRQASQPSDLICVTGSFFIAAEVRELLQSTA